MDVYDRVMRLCDQYHVTPHAVEKACGLSNASIRKLQNGSMSAERMQIIAEYFGVTVEYLLTGKEPAYYTNPESAAIAQEIFENPDLRMLFDTSRDISPEDMKFLIDMAKRMKATNPDG